MFLRSRWILGLVLLAAVLSIFAPLNRQLPIPERWHLAHQSEWPELDAKSTLPRRCAAKHAALEIAGVDPNLVRINLPRWQPQPQSNRTGIAYLAPCGLPHRVGIVARVFEQLYRPEDFFFYQVDRERPGLRQALEERLGEQFPHSSLPPNVVVANMPHSGRVFYWGHTANVFLALHEILRLCQDWEWIVHLHDGAYPAHAPEYMRAYLSARRGVNFMAVDPWDQNHWQSSRLSLVHSCESWVGLVSGQHFPQDEVTARGFHWAQGSEWWVLTRELAAYFVDERLRPFLNLMQYRMNVEEIVWASMVLNIPGLAQLVGGKLVWDTFTCQHPDCKESLHSPMNLEDTKLDLYYKELRDKLQDTFFVRTVTPKESEGLLAWLDARIYWEQRYAATYNKSGLLMMAPPVYPPKSSEHKNPLLRSRRGN